MQAQQYQKIKAYQLREKTEDNLKDQLTNLKKELVSLRTSLKSSAAQVKLARIRVRNTLQFNYRAHCGFPVTFYFKTIMSQHSIPKQLTNSKNNILSPFKLNRIEVLPESPIFSLIVWPRTVPQIFYV